MGTGAPLQVGRAFRLQDGLTSVERDREEKDTN